MDAMTPELNEIIRVFPRRTKWTPTDDLAFYDEPPMFDLPNLPVYMSVTFSWDLPHARKLWTSWVKRFGGGNVHIGGPALASPCSSFTPGQFIKTGVTFTSRGCPKQCPWCQVPKREGYLREIPIQAGHIVQDNNLLACSRPHIEAVFDMLRRQKRGIKFSGGLDIDYLKPWHIDLLKTIKVKELWVACDTEASLKRLDKAADLLSDFPTNKKRCYVLMGFDDDTPDKAERRCQSVVQKGFLPFAQLYQGPTAETLHLPHNNKWFFTRYKWCRPAVYRGKSAKSAIKGIEC
jgi:organic radical activating enzyme